MNPGQEEQQKGRTEVEGLREMEKVKCLAGLRLSGSVGGRVPKVLHWSVGPAQMLL